MQWGKQGSSLMQDPSICHLVMYNQDIKDGTGAVLAESSDEQRNLCPAEMK